MKRTTRIILIIICTLLIILSAVGVIWAFVNKFSKKAYADYLDVVNDQNAVINFNQLVKDNYTHNEYMPAGDNYIFDVPEDSIRTGDKLYFLLDRQYLNTCILVINNNISINSYSYDNIIDANIFSGLRLYCAEQNVITRCWLINLSIMYGVGNEPDLTQCRNIFNAAYYPYSTGTAISVNGFDQYNNGAMSIRESMTITTTSANIADNLDNVIINSSYGSTSKALIQGFMVWNTEDNYTNCTALFNLQTNFNEGDYFEFEFYTITGADTLSLPNQSFTMDLQIIAVDSSGSIVPLTTIKAQNNTTTPTKATFYLPFDTDKLYITTPHKYIVGYNNFNINITTTNLTALSLYSYQDGYRAGKSNGYTAGYNKGKSETNATLGTMEYIGAAFAGIGQVLQIELLPGVPFSLFILLPLMFGLIAFVVKLSKGGS